MEVDSSHVAWKAGRNKEQSVEKMKEVSNLSVTQLLNSVRLLYKPVIGYKSTSLPPRM
jgi:hypothetical protein